MARLPYFRYVPDFEYVSRLPDARISDYIRVKNLFKKVKIRSDIFEDLTYFTKYIIIGDERPDQVAFNVYEDENLDWLVLAANNIVNVQTEWPTPQAEFDALMLKKYGGYEELYAGIHHYETVELKNSDDVTILKAGLTVPENFTMEYYDSLEERMTIATDITVPVTNYEYEERLEDEKRNIYVLNVDYIHLITDELQELMKYEKGSTQYVDGTLKRADNIRLYQ